MYHHQVNTNRDIKRKYNKDTDSTVCTTEYRSKRKPIEKVRKLAKIRKRYNHVPQLTQDTTRESNKNTINIPNESQKISPSPAVDHKAAMNRPESMRNTRHKITQMNHKRRTAWEWSGKIFYWRA